MNLTNQKYLPILTFENNTDLFKIIIVIINIYIYSYHYIKKTMYMYVFKDDFYLRIDKFDEYLRNKLINKFNTFFLIICLLIFIEI